MSKTEKAQVVGMLKTEDAQFLAALGDEMRVQYTCDTNDPRYWVIQDEGWEACDVASAEGCEVRDVDGTLCGILHSMPELEFGHDLRDLEKAGVSILPVRRMRRDVDGCVFPTSVEAEDYLRRTRYRYESPRVFCRRSDSEALARLWQIVQDTDWLALVEGGDAA